MTGLSVRLFKPEAALSKVDLAGNPGIDHPLQGAIHGRPTDPFIFLPDQIHEIVRAQVSILADEHVDDLLTLAGTLAAGLEAVEIRKAGH